MRFVDANIFLTAIVKPVNDREEAKEHLCHALFDRLLTGEELARTHGVIIAEVAYVLSSRNKYRMAPSEIVQRLRPLVELTGLRLENKVAILRALDLWPSVPRLDFEDVIAVSLMHDDEDREIYSYDHHFDRVPHIERVEPE